MKKIALIFVGIFCLNTQILAQNNKEEAIFILLKNGRIIDFVSNTIQKGDILIKNHLIDSISFGAAILPPKEYPLPPNKFVATDVKQQL